MVWVDSPKLFCAFSEKLAGMENDLMHTLLPVPGYRAITNIPETGPVPTHTLYNLTHIDYYIRGFTEI